MMRGAKHDEAAAICDKVVFSKAMRRLGFKEPTPIQKSCFPAAAHQGKDVIGAAETGSGKILAFGLPILQRLLEKQEKGSRLHQEDEKMEKSAGESPLCALILTPTRELAQQVCDHLKEAAKFLGIGCHSYCWWYIHGKARMTFEKTSLKLFIYFTKSVYLA